MKKLLAALILTTLPISGIAHGNRYNHPPHNRHNPNFWVAPLIIGGVVGAAIASQRSAPVVTYPAYPVYPAQQYLPAPPYGYTYINVFDAYCGCYKWVLTSY